MKKLLVILAAAGCAHTAADRQDAVHRLPVRVANGVLATPLSTAPKAQLLRDALLLAMADRGFCIDRTGEYGAWLHLESQVEADGADLVTVTVDDGAGTQIDELSVRLDRQPTTVQSAGRSIEPLLGDLERSGPLRDLADDARPGPCAP